MADMKIAEAELTIAVNETLRRERDELLEALKAVVEKCVDAEYWVWSETSTDKPFTEPAEVASARALIARLEGKAHG